MKLVEYSDVHGLDLGADIDLSDAGLNVLEADPFVFRGAS